MVHKVDHLDMKSQTTMPSIFRWLHLTDLHYGSNFDASPIIRDAFFDDLPRILDISGPLNAVIVSGDLVDQFGWAAAREDLNRFFQLTVDIVGSDCPVLIVPGNHDVKRLQLSQVERKQLRALSIEDHARDEFFSMKPCSFREAIISAFDEFVSWESSMNFAKPREIAYGFLPGDFSTALQVGKDRVGILGLNSAYLSTDDSCTAMHVDVRQWNRSCNLDGPAWCRANRVTLLVTHHPPKTFHQQDEFEDAFGERGKFAGHICGDLHHARTVQAIPLGGIGWQLLQGPTFSGTPNRRALNGYVIGEVDIDNMWLRLCTRMIGQETGWRFVRSFRCQDSEFTPWIDIIASDGRPRPKTPDRPPLAISATTSQLPQMEDYPRPIEVLIPFARGEPVVDPLSLKPVTLECRQAIRRGHYEHALRLLYHYLIKPFYFHLNEFAVCNTILQELADGILSCGKPGWTSWVLDALGNCNGRLGRPLLAVECYSKALEVGDHTKNPSRALMNAIILGNRFLEQIRLGALRAAELDNIQRIKLLETLPEGPEVRFHRWTAHLGLAYLYAITSRPCDTVIEMERVAQAEPLALRGINSVVPMLQTIVYLARARKSEPEALENAIKYAVEAEENARKESVRDHIRARYFLGMVALAAAPTGQGGVAGISSLALGRSLLFDCLEKCRQVTLPELEPDILLGLARADKDVRLAEEALVLAKRCHYQLKQAEAHLTIAQLMRFCGHEDETAIQHHLRAAMVMAECDGGAYRFQRVIDDAAM